VKLQVFISGMWQGGLGGPQLTTSELSKARRGHRERSRKATWPGSMLDDLYVCGVTRGGSDLAIAGQQRRIERLGKRNVYRIVGS
jgi:hypothetical protein